MQDNKEIHQEYDQDGSLRSHKEIKQIQKDASPHIDLLNVATTMIMLITAVFCCTMIAIGAFHIMSSMLPKTEVHNDR